MILNQFHTGEADSVTVLRALGCKYRTDKGDFVDAISGMYNSPLGFGNEDLAEAAAAAMRRTSAHGFSVHPGTYMHSREQEELTAALLARVSFCDRVFYANSGSEAVDAALRFTRSQQCTRILSFRPSYHGSTDLAFRASSNLNTRAPKDHLYYEFYGHDDPRSKEEYLSDFQRFLDKHANTVAALIMEPAVGASGGIFMKENVLPEIHKSLQRHGIPLILDEVITGFWRLGHEFAHQLYGVEPDLLVLSKALTNGMWPLSTVLVKRGVVIQEPNFGFSMAGHPVGCSIALAALKLLDTWGPNASAVGQRFDRMFTSAAVGGGAGTVGNLLPTTVVYKRCGALIALHLYQDDGQRYDRATNIGGAVAKHCFTHNRVIVRGTPLSVLIAPRFLDIEGHSECAVTAYAIKEALHDVLR